MSARLSSDGTSVITFGPRGLRTASPLTGTNRSLGILRLLLPPTVALVLVCLGTVPLGAQSVADFAVQLGAFTSSNPPRVTLLWAPHQAATGHEVHRKMRDDSGWRLIESIAGATATNYVDSDVVPGIGYEYWVSRAMPGFSAEGYVYAGSELPLVENRGKVILIVQQELVDLLGTELEQLRRDLVGDGWVVVPHSVPRMSSSPDDTSPTAAGVRSNELFSVKSWVKTEFDADPAAVKSVFLLGHVPVPYSGILAPDDHGNHLGAWPADVFYADLAGSWTDQKVATTFPVDRRNWNTPGDGKFDQSTIPGTPVVEVGRVDFANLPAYSLPEVELIRRYLQKNQRFRHSAFSVAGRGLIDDHFGLATGEPFAVNGWRNFPPLLGIGNTHTGDWLPSLATETFLWGFGCGAGSYTSISGVASTSDYTSQDPKVVFTMFFGSYFGDWDSPNNVLRATLGTPTCTLAAVWAGRPNWQVHHMALGETIGFCTRLTQANAGEYDYNVSARGVHIALMGDPTLRMHFVTPVSGVAVAPGAAGGADLTWIASPDAVLGYHIYKSATAAGPFVRVNADLVPDTSFTDPTSPSPCVYMVRAVKLEVSASGSYYNGSTGIFVDFAGQPDPKPILTISALSTNKAYGAPLPGFTAVYNGFIDGDTPDGLTSPPVLTTDALQWSPVGDYAIQPMGAQSSKYSIVFQPATLSIMPADVTGILTASATSVLPDQLVTFQMTVSPVPPAAGTPTGVVRFKLGSGIDLESPLTNAVAACASADLPHGFNTVVAEYAGDENFLGCTNALTQPVLVNSLPLPLPDTIERSFWDGTKVRPETLLANDVDPDGDVVRFAGVEPISANGAFITLANDWIFYNPPVGFTNTDSFSYFVTDGLAQQVSGSVSVTVRRNEPPAPNLEIIASGDAGFTIRGSGVPGLDYRIQYTTDMTNSNWLPLGTATADLNGSFRYSDTNASEQRFYRSQWP